MDFNLKKWVDDLADKLDVSNEDFADELQKEKTSLNDWITAVRDEIEEEASETMTTLKGKLDELKLQLTLGKAEARDMAEEQEHKIRTSMNEVRTAIIDVRKDTTSETHSAVDKLESGLSSMGAALETKLELARMKFSLGKADLMEEFEETKEELRKKWDEAVKEMQATAEKAETRGEALTKEMEELYGKARSVISHFFRPETEKKEDTSA